MSFGTLLTSSVYHSSSGCFALIAILHSPRSTSWSASGAATMWSTLMPFSPGAVFFFFFFSFLFHVSRSMSVIVAAYSCSGHARPWCLPRGHNLACRVLAVRWKAIGSVWIASFLSISVPWHNALLIERPRSPLSAMACSLCTYHFSRPGLPSSSHVLSFRSSFSSSGSSTMSW